MDIVQLMGVIDSYPTSFYANINTMLFHTITMEELQATMESFSHDKSPWPDG